MNPSGLHPDNHNPSASPRHGATANGQAYSAPSTHTSSDNAIYTLPAGGPSGVEPAMASPASTGRKRVRFELLLLQSTHSPKHHRSAARLPMNLFIRPHDTTASIIDTVKNFYGLYEGQCVSFEDKEADTLIATYDNFNDNMTVYVRASPPGDLCDGGDAAAASANSPSPKRPRLAAAPIQMDMAPPEQPFGAHHAHGKRSASPLQPQPARSGRDTSVGSASKTRARSAMKGCVASSLGGGSSVVEYGGGEQQPQPQQQMLDDSDGGGSVSSSRKGKSEVLASAEISVENIVEGGRRKRAKFDSSELPLFVPSQVPMTASVSSVSPQRRVGSGSATSPHAYNNAHTFAYPAPLPSPQSHHHNDVWYGNGGGYSGAASSSYSTRYGTRHGGAGGRQSVGGAAASAVLATPDPTSGGSVISDEDVALQLMRLGEAGNMSSTNTNWSSTHGGRTSTSTVGEDAYSGRAEKASSADDSEDGSSDGDEDDAVPLEHHQQQHRRLLELHQHQHQHADSRVEPGSYSSADDDDGEDDDDDDDDDDGFNGLGDEKTRLQALEAAFKAQHGNGNGPLTKLRGAVAGAGAGARLARPAKAQQQRQSAAGKSQGGGGGPKTKAAHAHAHGHGHGGVGATAAGVKFPLSPASAPAKSQSRKVSKASSVGSQQQQQQQQQQRQVGAGAADEDLSSKPRCQRCRKSKKGCDRQRPCGRCRDAGIGADGCVSEDEGNGRKGRFGRWMGVGVGVGGVEAGEAKKRKR